jgi:hypothetical protein
MTIITRQMLFIIGLAISIASLSLTVACGGGSLDSPAIGAATPNRTATPTPAPTPNPEGIRAVDFRNHTFPWYPSFLKSASREITLSDGKLEIEEDRRAGIANLSLELEDISYAKLTGDASEQAIVTLAGLTGVNRFVGAVFIFGLQNGKPGLIWKHETGDRAEGGLRRLAVDGETLILEEYTRSEGDGGLCCPKQFRRSEYKWNGRTFEQIKSQTLPNEYSNANFLGYPDRPPPH